MIYLKKSADLDCLDLLKTAQTTDDANVYRSGKVYEKIKSDFHEKCYLCEDNEVTSIQIEHFEPHKSDLVKKYKWENLFFSCGHCNNIKGAGFWPLLDCTSSTDKVWESIEIVFTAFPKAQIDLFIDPHCAKPAEAKNTAKLLEKALAGKNATAMKTDEAATIRKKMLRAHKDLSAAIVSKNIEAVRQLVADSSAFAGMLRWELKRNFPTMFQQIFP